MTPHRRYEEVVLNDDHVVDACAPPDASACLGSSDATAGRFDAHREGPRSPLGDLDLLREREDRRPEDRALTINAINGTSEPIRFRLFHVTLRANLQGPSPATTGAAQRSR